MAFDIDEKSVTDDEIIELTDIIEKGKTAPSSDPAPAAAQEDIFGDLGNTKAPDMPSDMDVDLDALLAQMGDDGDFSHLESANAQASAEESSADTAAGGTDDFDLDAMLRDELGSDDQASAGNTPSSDDEALPDMSDIDALLSEMDMPEQPAQESASLNADAGQQSSKIAENPNSAAEMDDLLESLLSDAPAPKAAPAQQPAPSAAPATEDDIFDMLDLSEPAPKGGAAAVSAQEEEDAADSMAALFDSVLNDKPAPTPKAAPAAPTPVDVSALDFGEDHSASRTSGTGTDDDFDALFQDVLGEAPLSAADVAKVVVGAPEVEAAPVESDAEILDMLFGETPAVQPQAEPVTAPAPKEPVEEATNISDSSDTTSVVDTAQDAAVASAAVASVVMDQEIAPAQPTPATFANAEEFEKRLAQLEATVAENVQNGDEARTQWQGHMDGLQERLQQMEALVQTVQSAVAEASAAPADSASEETLAELKSIREQVADNAEHLSLVEERSQAVAREAAARDAAARDALSTYIDKLEAVAKEAVSKEAAAHTAVHSTIQRFENALQAQEELSLAYAKRITDLEERVQYFETHVQANMERMAVAAAAKILREEIAALLAAE